MQISDYTDQVMTLVIQYAPRVVLAGIALVLGLWLVGALAGLVRRGLEKRGTDPTLVPFMHSLITWILKAVVFISVAGIVGIETTSFVAILGAAGLAVGLALQGTLGNFAGGVMLMLFKPIAVGELIEVGGQTGWVKEIQIFCTVLLSPQNKTIVLANSSVSSGTIVNFSRHGNVRCDISVGISYGANIKQARDVLMQVMRDHPPCSASRRLRSTLRSWQTPA